MDASVRSRWSLIRHGAPLVAAIALYLVYESVFAKTSYPNPVRLRGFYAFACCVGLSYAAAYLFRQTSLEALRRPGILPGERIAIVALFLITPWGNLAFFPLPAAFWLGLALLGGAPSWAWLLTPFMLAISAVLVRSLRPTNARPDGGLAGVPAYLVACYLAGLLFIGVGAI